MNTARMNEVSNSTIEVCLVFREMTLFTIVPFQNSDELYRPQSVAVRPNLFVLFSVSRPDCESGTRVGASDKWDSNSETN